MDDSVRPVRRCIDRREPEANVRDMLELLNSDALDSVILPVFAAQNLSKIPSVAPHHVDSSQLLRCLKEMQAELCESRQQWSSLRTTLDEVRNDRDGLKSALDKLSAEMSATRCDVVSAKHEISSLSGVVNRMQSSTSRSYSDVTDSRPVSAMQAYSVQPKVSQVSTDSTVRCEGSTNTAFNTEAPVSKQASSMKPSCSSSVKDTQENSSNSVSKEPVAVGHDGFTVVKPRGRRPGVTGIGSKPPALCKLQVRTVVPVKRVKIFVSRFDAKTTCSDIQDFVGESFSCSCSVEELKTKHDSYASFLVSLDFHVGTYEEAWKKALDSDSWPRGIFYRRYFVKRSGGSENK